VRDGPHKILWAYAYEIVPPPAKDQLTAIRPLLEAEHADAKLAKRTWTAKLVCEQQATHILVVSDSPDQRRDVNRRLESRLTQFKAAFSLTVPMAVGDD
jgi:hypothetical protein